MDDFSANEFPHSPNSLESWFGECITEETIQIDYVNELGAPLEEASLKRHNSFESGNSVAGIENQLDEKNDPVFEPCQQLDIDNNEIEVEDPLGKAHESISLEIRPCESLNGETKVRDQPVEPDDCIDLPAYDEGLVTKKWLILGLVFTCLACVITFIFTILIFQYTAHGDSLTGAKNVVILPASRNNHSSGHDTIQHLRFGLMVSFRPSNPIRLQEALTYILSFAVTLCNECLGFIHTVSLRWALYHQGALKYNSNLRLLTCSKVSIANTWYGNIAFGLFVAFTYGSVAQFFATLEKEPFLLGFEVALSGGVSILSSVQYRGLVINGVALGGLFVGLLGQLLLASCSLLTMRKRILTWSSNPLNNALACLHGSRMHRESGRSMRPCSDYFHTEFAELRFHPSNIQPSLLQSRLCAIRALCPLWASSFATLAGAAIIFLFNGSNSPAFGIFDGSSFFSGRWARFTISSNYGTGQLFISFLVTTALQTYLTFSLHGAEVLVNASRDERSWRCAKLRSGSGAETDVNAIWSAVTNFETVGLFAFKTIIHWVFSTCLGIGFGLGPRPISYVFAAYPLFLLSGLLFLVSAYATFVAARQPRGPQPSTFGHFQTLINLIDVWPNPKQRIFWGDKTNQEDQTEAVRRAGTETDRSLLKPIVMDAIYS